MFRNVWRKKFFSFHLLPSPPSQHYFPAFMVFSHFTKNPHIDTFYLPLVSKDPKKIENCFSKNYIPRNIYFFTNSLTTKGRQEVLKNFLVNCHVTLTFGSFSSNFLNRNFNTFNWNFNYSYSFHFWKYATSSQDFFCSVWIAQLRIYAEKFLHFW